MIVFKNLCNELPYIHFKKIYDNALLAGQQDIEAIAISSFNNIDKEVDSRYVNLKFVDESEFIFFSNYNSIKSLAFNSHNQIGALLYWSATNMQIRMKANIKKTTKEYNSEYFKNRSADKNALAISSNQSQSVPSYKEIVLNYNKVKENNDLTICPDYWGGYSFTPYYFEFWEGHHSRINKRDVYKKNGKNWDHFILQP